MTIPWQVGGGKGYLERFRGNSVAGGQRGDATWNAFAGIPCQVGREGHLERFCGNSVAGGRRERTPGTLSREFRGRWEAGKATWNAFAGIPWQVEDRERTPGTLLQGFRARWGGREGHLERFCRDSVPGRRRERLPGTILREFRGRWAAGKATWNAFAGIPWQVDSGMRHLERFSGDTVAGGRQDGTPGTLLQGFRARWTARRDTWNAFAGIPCQVGSGMGHLAQPQQE